MGENIHRKRAHRTQRKDGEIGKKFIRRLRRLSLIFELAKGGSGAGMGSVVYGDGRGDGWRRGVFEHEILETLEKRD